jgi:putative transcription antitermination factor YqgF
MQYPVVLAFDFGTRRIGVARSHATLAEPLEVLANDTELWNRIACLIREHQPVQLLVGVSEAEMAEQSRAFGTELGEKTRLPVTFVDETLSSNTVHAKLAERQKGKAQYRGAIDHFAAAEFLQEWLDEQS